MSTNKNQTEQVLVASGGAVTIEGGQSNGSPNLLQAEQVRIARINAVFDGLDASRPQVAELRANALLGAVPEDQLAGRALALLRASRTQGPAIHVHSSQPSGADVIGASFMLRAGYENYAVTGYGERVVDEARRIGLNNSVDVLRACIRLDGRDVPARANLDELLRAAAGSTTFSLPVALSDSANKTILPLYHEMPQWWREHCFVAACDNFHEQKQIRPTMGGTLEEVGADGELKTTGPLREITASWTARTFGRTVNITRTDWRNDDLGFFSQIVPMLAKMAARGVSDLAAEVLLANAGNFFSVGNNNLAEAGSAFSVEALAAGIKAFRERRDRDNNDLSLIPRVLGVATALEMAAKAALESEYLARAADLDNMPTGNPLRSMLKVVPESRLSNSAKFPNASDEAWYLFGSPSDVPMIAGFLDGRQTPTIETFDFSSSPNFLKMTTRCYLDFGFALGDPAAAYKATGAAE